MKKKALSLLLTTVLLASFGASYSLDNDEREEVKELVNSNTDQIPDAVAAVIGDEDFNFVVETEDSKEYIGVEMDGMKVDSIENTAVKGATANIVVKESAMEELVSSESPVADAKELYDEGDIELVDGSVPEDFKEESEEKSEETQEGDDAGSITGGFTESASSAISNAVDTVKVSAANLVLGLI
jgi:hypothetical protein